MARFFVPADRIRGDTVLLHGDDAHHATRVLRRGPGDRFWAVGPDGSEYLVEIERVDAGVPSLVGRILERRRPEREPRLRVTVAQALIKGDKMDWVIQKATELGAWTFWPFAAARSVVRLEPARAHQRAARWARVAEAAAKQCGRLRVPEVNGVLAFPELVQRVRDWHSARGQGSVVFAWEGETEHGLFDLLWARLGPPTAGGVEAGAGPAAGPAAGGEAGAQAGPRRDDLLLIVGPEGGFDPSEARALLAAGASPVTVGRLILRAETAAPAILAMILYHSGDLGRAPR